MNLTMSYMDHIISSKVNKFILFLMRDVALALPCDEVIYIYIITVITSGRIGEKLDIYRGMLIERQWNQPTPLI